MCHNSTDNRYHLGGCKFYHAKSFVCESHRYLPYDIFLLCSVHNVGVYWSYTQRKGKGTAIELFLYSSSLTSLSPSSAKRKKKIELKIGCTSPGFRAASFPRVTHDELNERGTTRSPQRLKFTESFLLLYVLDVKARSCMVLIELVRKKMINNAV